MSTVAEQYPARTDDNDTTWYRPERRAGESMSQWGWTADPEQADPSYAAPRAADGPTHHYVITDDPTTEEDTSMTAIADDGEIVGRTTEWQGYPLPPEPPRFQPKFNGWKQYLLPSPTTGRPTGFARATTISDTLDDTFGLSRWKRRETVRYVLSLLDRAAESTPEGNRAAERVEELRTAYRTASKVGIIDGVLDLIDNEGGGKDAAELGTCVHAWLEALDLGTVLYRDLPEFIRPYADAYYAILTRFGLIAEPIYCERIVLNDRGEESVVGTLDRIYRVVSTGELVLGDVKTSKSLEYSWLPYAVQLAVYGWATKMLKVDGSGWEHMPPINKEFAILMHIPSDQPERSQAVTMDLWWGGGTMVTAIETRRLRKEAKNVVPFKHAIPVPSPEALRYVEARRALMDISAPEDLNRVWEQYQDVWDDALTALGEQLAALL